MSPPGSPPALPLLLVFSTEDDVSVEDFPAVATVLFEVKGPPRLTSLEALFVKMWNSASMSFRSNLLEKLPTPPPTLLAKVLPPRFMKSASDALLSPSSILMG